MKFTSLVHNDGFAAAKRLAAPGSPAEKYVTHQRLADEAWVLSGDAGDDDDVTYAFTNNAVRQTIRVTQEYDGKQFTYTWSDWEVDPQGKVVTWTGKSGPLEDVLWTKSSRVATLGGSFTLKSAYRSNSGDLAIVVDIKAGSQALEAYTPTLIDKSGRIRQATSWSYSDKVPAGASALAFYSFDGAKFGGALVYSIYTDSGPVTVKLPVR